MNLEEYLVLVADYTDDYDRTAVIRAYHEYRKENPVADTESAHRHIQMHLPQEGAIILRNILNDFGTASAYEVDKAVRWLRQQRYTIADSLCGPCTDIVAANALRVFLINAISVQSEFEGFCNELGTRFTLAMYADFKRHHGSYLVSTRHHPYLTDSDFWMGSTAELHNVFAKWYMGYSACDPCDRNGYMSVAECAEMLEIKVPNLINWVWAHPECYVLHKGRCLISKAKVDALQIEWQNVYMVADILIPRLDQIPSKSRPKVKTETMELLASFGRILAIAAAHYQLTDSESFVVPVTDWYTIKQFFGSDFLKACGNRPFSGRRANKALLQSVEFVGREDSQLPPMITYHLASIMRSHKLSCGKPSMVTDIYLRDANFAGQAPEYVAYQMFERGVCSFVVDVMLEKCYGREYTRLSVGQKTQAITELGLSPAGAAGVLQCIQIAQDRAVETLAEVCQDNATIESALKMIASGRGHGKDQDVYCLCKAAGKTCLHRDRLSCLGCKYEIKTKALLLRYAVVHQSLASADGTSDAEQIRRKYLYTNVTWPAMMELLSHLERDTIPTEFNLYRNLVEEAMTYGITSNCVS